MSNYFFRKKLIEQYNCFNNYTKTNFEVLKEDKGIFKVLCLKMGEFQYYFYPPKRPPYILHSAPLGNYNHVNDVTSGRKLGFPYFQIFFIFELNTENSEKTSLSFGIYRIVRSIAKLSVFMHFFCVNSYGFVSEGLISCSEHTSCVSYYDDVISHDIT